MTTEEILCTHKQRLFISIHNYAWFAWQVGKSLLLAMFGMTDLNQFASQYCAPKNSNILSKKPTFTVRGLCKDAVMDTQYKFSDHKPGPANARYLQAPHRSYVGPKGWIISKDNTDDKWRMTHYHYTDLTLTMLDSDALPVGRHKWLGENNVCQEGKTHSCQHE